MRKRKSATPVPVGLKGLRVAFTDIFYLQLPAETRATYKQKILIFHRPEGKLNVWLERLSCVSRPICKKSPHMEQTPLERHWSTRFALRVASAAQRIDFFAHGSAQATANFKICWFHANPRDLGAHKPNDSKTFSWGYMTVFVVFPQMYP